MKTKKLLPMLATLVVGATAALSGCTAGNTTIEFKNNWLKNPINPQESLTETLTYDVKFEKNESAHNKLAYEYAYTNGVYTTTLTQFSTDQFQYTTKLTIDVAYSNASGESLTVTDVVETSVLFQAASKGLAPVHSSKTVLSHFPLNITDKGAKLSDCYQKANYTMSTVYAEGKGVCTYQDLLVENGQPETINVNMGEKLSYLDNEQLLVALRAFDASTSSGNVNVFSPFVKGTQKIGISFGSEEEASAQLTISENGGEAATKTFKYRVATLEIKATNAGQKQTAWVALDNRHVVLRLETPYSFNHGKLVYTLKTIDRTEK